jgi:hypothetical protein
MADDISQRSPISVPPPPILPPQPGQPPPTTPVPAVISNWFGSHKLSAHITMASLLSVFGTVYTLYNMVPQFKALCLRANAALPSLAEAVVSAAVAVMLFYWKTSKPTT